MRGSDALYVVRSTSISLFHFIIIEDYHAYYSEMRNVNILHMQLKMIFLACFNMHGRSCYSSGGTHCGHVLTSWSM